MMRVVALRKRSCTICVATLSSGIADASRGCGHERVQLGLREVGLEEASSKSPSVSVFLAHHGCARNHPKRIEGDFARLPLGSVTTLRLQYAIVVLRRTVLPTASRVSTTRSLWSS